MSIGFYATLAGERLNTANRNYDAAHSWHMRAEELEDELAHERNANRQLQHQLNQAIQHNASWQAHAQQLEEKVRNWQQAAIESEAISRAKTAMIREDNGGNGPKVVFGEDRYNKEVEVKKEEVVREWGVNPWAE